MGLLGDIFNVADSFVEDMLDIVREGDIEPDQTLDSVGDLLDNLFD